MRFVAAWLLYGLGTAALAVGLPYRSYNRLMLWSSDVQGPGEAGPWGKELDD